MDNQAHRDRLTAIDASFLHQEKQSSHMHVGALVTFEGPPPARDDFIEQLESRLGLIPRYRQRLAFPPLELGRPFWVDDPSFNLHYHVRHTALPRPGQRRAAARAGRAASSPSASIARSRCGSCGSSRASSATASR